MLNELETSIHNCVKCKSLNRIIKYYPVISFGDPRGKQVIIVGLNPSTKEYELGFLTRGSVEERHLNQISYFEKAYYEFFCKLAPFFMGEAKQKIGWSKTPWEKVGYLDIVKCPTRSEDNKQWSKLKSKERKEIMTNCQDWLRAQLLEIRPKLIIVYGSSACGWFDEKYKPKTVKPNINLGFPTKIIFLNQTQGQYTLDEIEWVRKTIVKNL